MRRKAKTNLERREYYGSSFQFIYIYAPAPQYLKFLPVEQLYQSN